MSIIRQTGRPNATVNLIDPITQKIVATTTADAKGLATFASVPAGEWKEQIIYTQQEGPGVFKTLTQISPIVTDFRAAQGAHGPVVTDANGSLWQLGVLSVADPTSAPGLATATTGGSMVPGTYTVGYTWTTPNGETKLSPTAQIVVPAGTSTNTITATTPAVPANASGLNLYIAPVNATSPQYRQNGAPLSGTSNTQTAAPTTTGANPPSASTAGVLIATKLAN